MMPPIEPTIPYGWRLLRLTAVERWIFRRWGVWPWRRPLVSVPMWLVDGGRPGDLVVNTEGEWGLLHRTTDDAAA